MSTSNYLRRFFQLCKFRLSFDTEILLPSIEIPDKVNWRDYSCKVSYNLKLERKKKYSTKKVISKILKLFTTANRHHSEKSSKLARV